MRNPPFLWAATALKKQPASGLTTSSAVVLAYPIALLIALVMLVVTVLLIVNTMRVAAFSRRRETSIMRLVGASNFYIQLPFLLEAALAAALGALLAIGALVLMKSIIIDQVLAPSFQFTAFVGWDAVATIAPLIFITGVGLAGIAAFFTLRKYLRV